LLFLRGFRYFLPLPLWNDPGLVGNIGLLLPLAFRGLRVLPRLRPCGFPLGPCVGILSLLSLLGFDELPKQLFLYYISLFLQL